MSISKTTSVLVPLLLSPTLLCAAEFNAADSMSPKELYDASCAACHGPDGRGRTQQEVGFSLALPDFTDCSFASREPDGDWFGIIHEGGPVRGFNRMMPAFGEALSEDEINDILSHVRTFCEDKSWPPGEFNIPRALFTEKAFPEDEAVVTNSVNLEGDSKFISDLLYEKRVGARSMFEILVPVGFQETGLNNDNSYGIGDIVFDWKHTFYHNLDKGSIFSGGAEVVLPTGDELKGFGNGTTIWEAFMTYGQLLPNDAFFQLHTFVEFPIEDHKNDEAGLRMALGKTWTESDYGRSWSPMIETLITRDLISDADTNVDLVPQFQISLNTRQHILLNVGLRIPITDSGMRDTQLVFYFLWDWFDGGLKDGW